MRSDIETEYYDSVSTATNPNLWRGAKGFQKKLASENYHLNISFFQLRHGHQQSEDVMQTNAFSFASRLRVLRENRRLSKTALANHVGVSTTCVWNWEEGNTEPRSENLLALSKVLNAPVAYLQDGAEWADAPPVIPAVTQPSPAGLTLAEVIADAKSRIALLAGILPEKVNISLEY